MFNKILIANRGEIALRVICACRELGIKTVAVYSEADEHSLHVRFADEDVCIGPARSLDSYLNVPAIISAAEITGADAIHPGYGFLSESAYLAEVCEACHIKFIGPYPNVIRLMGDKARARRAMKKAGVPVLPGSDGPVQGEEQAIKVAKELGYPVIIKAVAGGGGRGMRVVRSADELREVAEDGAARGRGGVRRRRRLSREVRRVAAAHRDPGARRSPRQRDPSRRARVLDSAPPSEADRRGAVGGADREAAPQARRDRRRRRARPCSTRTPGTFEFLMDPTGHFYFLEANTRLQVEHPVTEFVTGVDIVKEQIRIAAGQRLSVRQSDIEIRGHSIECRINAEDPETFVPSPGVIHAFSVPGGPGVRVDTYAHSECTVSPYYDSLIAKIITLRPRPHRSDRPHAPHARDDGRRRHQDVDPAASQDPAAIRTSSPGGSARPSWSGS